MAQTILKKDVWYHQRVLFSPGVADWLSLPPSDLSYDYPDTILGTPKKKIQQWHQQVAHAVRDWMTDFSHQVDIPYVLCGSELKLQASDEMDGSVSDFSETCWDLCSLDQGPVQWAIDPVILNYTLNRLLGNKQSNVHLDSSGIDHLKQWYVQKWRSVILGLAGITENENPDIQKTTWGEAIRDHVWVQLSIQVYQYQGALWLSYPYDTLKAYWDGMPWGDHSVLDQGHDLAFSSVSVPLQATLGTTSMSLEEILTLEVGDILQLKACATDPIQIKLNGNMFGMAQPCRKGSQLAIQMKEVMVLGDQTSQVSIDLHQDLDDEEAQKKQDQDEVVSAEENLVDEVQEDLEVTTEEPLQEVQNEEAAFSWEDEETG